MRSQGQLNFLVSPDGYKVVKHFQDKQPFERLEVSKEHLLEMFKYNQFKVCVHRFEKFKNAIPTKMKTYVLC